MNFTDPAMFTEDNWNALRLDTHSPFVPPCIRWTVGKRVVPTDEPVKLP
jgi:hypothetical protein